MTAHRYWRLYSPADAGAGSTAIAELELRASSSGSNLSVSGNGTASASSTNGASSAADAFDGSASSWVSGGGSPQWLKWDFGAGNEQDIRYVTITTTNATYCPVNGLIQWSDDNTNWVSYISLASLPAAVATTSFVPPTGTATLSAQPGSALGYGHTTAALTMPLAVTVGYGAINVAIVTLPATVSSFAASKIALAMQAPTVFGAGHDATGERSFAATMPLIQVSGTFGGGGALVAMGPTLSASGTVPGIGRANIMEQDAVVAGSGTVSGLGRAAVTMTTATLVGYSGAICSVTDNGVTLQASGTAGVLGQATITLPLCTLVARGTTRGLSSGALIMPSPVLGAGGNVAWLVVPGATIVAVGGATVTVTYEGYSLNLLHTKPARQGEVQVDELTHYTNYPFDRIVRYQNSYYGVAPDGLYLLEGTTDYDPVTPAEVHYEVTTALTDFDIHEKKTVVAMHVGGRLGPSATISVTAGEKDPVTYHYKTPRNDKAQTYRQVFGKGIKTRYAAFSMEGSGPLTVDSLDFDLAKMTRRI